MKPYAQAASDGTVPILFGALPYSTSPTRVPTFVTFAFSPRKQSILNSTVIGPQGRSYFVVNTDNASPSSSAIRNPQLEMVARIEWRTYTVLEIGGILARSSATQWLALGSAGTYRTMTARGRTFRWTPTGNYVELSSSGVPTPQLFGRISQGRGGNTILELIPEAVHIGLIEVCVAATVILMSGRNIE